MLNMGEVSESVPQLQTLAASEHIITKNTVLHCEGARLARACPDYRPILHKILSFSELFCVKALLPLPVLPLSPYNRWEKAIL